MYITTRREPQASRPLTVLIIDDESLAKNVYQLLLTQEGYRVLLAKDGLSGLALLMREPQSPELILVDCSMPLMDGERIILELQKRLPWILSESKVVGFTSYDPQSLPFAALQKVAFDCREKPSDIEGIVRIVSDYIGMPTVRVYA